MSKATAACADSHIGGVAVRVVKIKNSEVNAKREFYGHN